MTPEQLQARKEKAEAIFKAARQAADALIEVLRQLPKKENIFRKSYNRRPQRKMKQQLVNMKAMMAARIGAYQLMKVVQQPIPKFPIGTDGVMDEAVIFDKSSKEETVIKDGKIYVPAGGTFYIDHDGNFIFPNVKKL